MMQDPLLVSPRYSWNPSKQTTETLVSCCITTTTTAIKTDGGVRETHLQSSRDDPEEVGHDVRDEQVRVDCVAQAAEVPVRHHQSRIPNNVCNDTLYTVQSRSRSRSSISRQQ